MQVKQGCNIAVHLACIAVHLVCIGADTDMTSERQLIGKQTERASLVDRSLCECNWRTVQSHTLCTAVFLRCTRSSMWESKPKQHVAQQCFWLSLAANQSASCLDACCASGSALQHQRSAVRGHTCLLACADQAAEMCLMQLTPQAAVCAYTGFALAVPLNKPCSTVI